MIDSIKKDSDGVVVKVRGAGNSESHFMEMANKAAGLGARGAKQQTIIKMMMGGTFTQLVVDTEALKRAIKAL